AADQVCDTPPDYNFGFAANGCRFTQQIRDPNNELVVTQEKNQMGYFNNCDEYFFTEGQYTRMFTSLMSASRSYVRLIYNPITAAIADKPIIVDLPAVIPTYNNVFIQWTPVPGATHYLVEFTDGRSYRYSIQSGTSVRTFDLEANRNYFVRVRPFNEYFTNTQTEIRTFRTGNILSSTSNNEDDQFLIDLIGNPISKGNRDIQFNIYSTMNFPATVKLFDVQGKLIRIENKQIESGTVLHSIPTSNLNTGLHILSVESEYGRITKKLIIY
ncbi:MAG TPA: T9SS type A sorting domain-containing protein, partial [Saprospiraceae bacterium]|nr:T9SS type A sorting domain-containing protein [Saprospiraceae bacterium]